MNLDDLLKSIREEDDSKGAKIDPEKFLTRKTFENPLKGQRYQAPGLPSAPVVFKPTIVKIDPKKIIPENTVIIGEEYAEKIDELVNVIQADNELERENQKNINKQLEDKRKKDREDRIETKKETNILVLDLKKSTGKVAGFFDKLKSFIKLGLLSGLINTLYNFFTDPKNKEKIEAIQGFLRDWWPALAAAIGFILMPFKGLILNTIGFLTSTTFKILRLFATNPIFGIAVAAGVAGVMDYLKGKNRKLKLQTEVEELMESEGISETEARKRLIQQKEEEARNIPYSMNPFDDKRREILKEAEQLKNIDFERTRYGFFGDVMNRAPGFKGGGFAMGTDIIPAMLTPGEFIMSRGAVNMFGADTMMAMNKMGGGTNRPKYGKVTGYQGGGIVDKFSKAVGISKQEYEAFRKSIAFIESNGQPDNGYGAIGGSNNHYDGKYQLGELGKMDAARILGETYPGHGKPESAARAAFRADRAMQDRFFTALALANHGYMSQSEMYRNLPSNKKLSILGFAHNQGWKPATTYLETGFDDEDGFGTKGSKYVNAIDKALKDLKPVSAVTPSSMTTAPGSMTSAPGLIATAPGSLGPAFSDDASMKQLSKQQQLSDNLSSIRSKLSDPIETFIRAPLRRVFPVGTPNVPTETRNFTLPPIDAPKQNQSVSQRNDVPTFSVVSGNKMRDLISKDLGIGDLVSAS